MSLFFWDAVVYNTKQLKMDLTVKSHLLSRNFINKISLNHPYNILAIIAESADTVTFFHLQSKPADLQEIFQGTSKPSGNKSTLVWSDDGNYLALGSSHLQLWKFDGKKIAPVKTFNEDFIDIKIIAWSPDSLSMAYGGLSKKNTVKIKNIQSGATQELSIPLVVCAISYDPFGKYLLLLLRNNIVYLYNSSSLSKIREVPLSPEASPLENVNTVKELRVMGWSPDFNHLVCPSLDDSKVAVALNFSRNNSFKVRQAFLGHVSSISCSRFNPNLYQSEGGDITSILALGDSHGVVSLWRVGKQIYNSPLLILNSNSEYSEVVDNLQWSQSGQTLLVNVMKRYVNIYTFDKVKFGREISQLQKTNIIEQSYGVTSVSEISHKQLEVFTMDAVQNISQQEIRQGNSGPVKEIKLGEGEGQSKSGAKGGNEGKIGDYEFAGKIEYVKVHEQVTTKDKQNRKKIQPAMLVRKDQMKNSGNGSQSNLPVLPGSLHAYSTIGSYEPLKLKPAGLDINLIKIGQKGYLQLKRLQGYTIVKLFEQKETERGVLNERVFTGSVDWIKIAGEKMYLLNMGNLYIFGWGLNLIDLPYNLGDVHRIVINELGDVYYISTKGLIKGFNHISKTCYTPVPVILQSLLEGVSWKPFQDQNAEDKDQQYQKVIEHLEVENNHNLYVTLQNAKNRYFYCRQTQCWVSLELNAGLLQTGHSLRVGEHEDRLATDFFQSLTTRFLPGNSVSTQTPLQQFQSNMIYYKLHNPNPELYCQNLLSLLRELKTRNQPLKLRTEITKYFVNKDSGYYIMDSVLRAKVRQIGGSVIQEFVMFGQL